MKTDAKRPIKSRPIICGDGLKIMAEWAEHEG